MEMIKVKRTIEYLQSTCKCGKVITGHTKEEVINNMNNHSGSLRCSLNSSNVPQPDKVTLEETK